MLFLQSFLFHLRGIYEQITNRSAVSVEYRVRLGSEPLHLTARTQLTTSFQHADHRTTQPVIGNSSTADWLVLLGQLIVA